MKHMTGSMHWNMAYGVPGVSSATQHVMRMTKLYACKTDKVHAAMVTAQERHCHVSTEEAERYASPANC